MNKSVLAFILFVILSTTSSILDAKEKNVNMTKEVEETGKALESIITYFQDKDHKDYPEFFNEHPYNVRIKELLVSDIDNDGKKEIILVTNPHYRQSPTITFYKINEKMEIVSRVKEGLAPGAIKPVSGDYLNSHELGFALDLVMETNVPYEKIVKIGLKKQNFGMVVYKNFYHIDTRSGIGMYIDMTHADMPNEYVTCDNFEFSNVNQISIGKLNGDPKNYLAAWAGDDIYIYFIKSISQDGMLDKKYWIQKAPIGFKGFLSEDRLEFKSEKGTVEYLKIDTRK